MTGNSNSRHKWPVNCLYIVYYTVHSFFVCYRFILSDLLTGHLTHNLKKKREKHEPIKRKMKAQKSLAAQ